MHHMGYSVQKIDEILKKKSGLLGLTGIDLDIDEMLNFYGKEERISQAIQIYFFQLKKYMGESIALLNGLDNLVFSGKSIWNMVPLIYSMVKDISYFDIALKPLPWKNENLITKITSDDSKVKAYINSSTLPEVIYQFSLKYLEEKYAKEESYKRTNKNL